MTMRSWRSRLSGDAAATTGRLLLFQLIYEIDQIEEAPSGAGANDRATPRRCKDGFFPCPSRQRHGAGILASEETIYYAFHPLAGRIVSSSGRRVVRCGDVHLTIRLADGTLTLTPEWMLRPAAAGCAIRSAPRLCVARLRDLRAYLDAVLGFYDGDSPLTDGADNASEPPTTGSIRRAAPPATDPEGTPPSDGGKRASASDGGSFAESLDFDPEGGAP